MNEMDRQRDERLARNVERLLSGAPPELEMPREAKQRVLDRLKQLPDGGAASLQRAAPSTHRRAVRRMTILAAAAVLVVALLALWPGEAPRGGVAWADVAQRMDEATSFSAWAELSATGPDGEQRTTLARVYQKDPALTRTERLRPGVPFPPVGAELEPGDVESITITESGRERSTILRLDPATRTARRTTLTFAGDALDARIAHPRDLVSGTWSRLRYLASDQTRSIGWRELDGRSVVGFEAEIHEMIPPPTPGRVDGWLRLWADEQSGVPVRVELELSDPQGTLHRSTFSRLEWNVELPDGFFAVPEDGSWTILQQDPAAGSSAPRRLAPEVTFRVESPSGTPLLTERDVVSAELDGTAPGLTLALRVSEQAGRRLREYTAAHRGEKVTIDFDGEVRVEVTIAAEIGSTLRIDLERLGISREEFRRRYLALGPAGSISSDGE
jgi:outer membrane lipoprotein-sorting protein